MKYLNLNPLDYERLPYAWYEAAVIAMGAENEARQAEVRRQSDGGDRG